MKVIIFGATGMIGQGVLRECVLDENIEQILVIGRTPIYNYPPKVRMLIREDLMQYEEIQSELIGYDACFFCLGTTSAGKSEADYKQITYDLTLAAAHALYKVNPSMVFIYVSAWGADSSEMGPIMWARIRGKTENALLEIPFKGVYCFRPGFIQPLDGIESKTKWTRLFYHYSKPLMPLLTKLFKKSISSTAQIGQAMIEVAATGSNKKILSTKDFAEIVKKAP